MLIPCIYKNLFFQTDKRMMCWRSLTVSAVCRCSITVFCRLTSQVRSPSLFCCFLQLWVTFFPSGSLRDFKGFLYFKALHSILLGISESLERIPSLKKIFLCYRMNCMPLQYKTGWGPNLQVPQNATLFGDRVITKVTKFKWIIRAVPNPKWVMSL